MCRLVMMLGAWTLYQMSTNSWFEPFIKCNKFYRESTIDSIFQQNSVLFAVMEKNSKLMFHEGKFIYLFFDICTGGGQGAGNFSL